MSSAPRLRRTQAERRATTRTALLEAALAALAQDGYAQLTTRGVARRAGVAQATQQHHFATKSELVAETMRLATWRLADEVLQRLGPEHLADAGRQEAMLDELWRIHRSDVFKAALELWVAARTDDELRAAMADLVQEVREMVAAGTAALVGDRDPGLAERVTVTLAAIRGYAMLAPVVAPDELDRTWEQAKPHLLATLRATTARA